MWQATALCKFCCSTDAPGPVEIDGEEEYFIDRIVDHKKIGCWYKYLVCWKGEHAGADRWITEKYLIETEALENTGRNTLRNATWILNISKPFLWYFPFQPHCRKPLLFYFLCFAYFYILILLVYIFVFCSHYAWTQLFQGGGGCKAATLHLHTYY